MTRGPTTFSLILGLVALAVVMALAMAAGFSIRGGIRVISSSYGNLVTGSALAIDLLSSRSDPESAAVVERVQELGMHFSTDAAPPPSAALAPMLIEFQHRIGLLLGDPTRVVVTQTPSPQIWIRSAHDPQRWMVMNTVSYRQQVIDSTLFVAIIAGLIALGIAAIAARLMTRPLERLAQNANEWLAGGPMDNTLEGSPREVHRLAMAIGAAGERLRNASRERELMLAGISHDLRTPLARLRLALELGDAADPQRSTAMVDDLDQLDSALEQCLAFVRDGRDEALRDIDVVTIAGQLLSLRSRPDDWDLSAPPTLYANVRPTLVRRAIGNLMDNAERYGAPPFSATLWRDNGNIRIRIADRGPGVAPELLGKLGQPFLRGDPARGGIGSGLGLSIVSRAARLHGGNLHLSNAPGGGFVAEIDLAVGPLRVVAAN